MSLRSYNLTSVKKSKNLLIFAALLSLSFPAFAEQTAESSQEDLEKKVVSLEQKIAALETLLQKMEVQIKDSVYTKIDKNLNQMENDVHDKIYSRLTKENKNNKKLEAKLYPKDIDPEPTIQEIAKLEPSAGSKTIRAAQNDEFIFSMNPSPKIESADGRYSFQPDGFLQLDTGFFSDDKNDNPDGAKLRSARMGFRGKLDGDWKYRFEIDLGDEEVDFTNTYVEYIGIDSYVARVGHFKPNFGLENLASNAHTTFLERASPVGAFATSFILGAAVEKHYEEMTFALGLHNDDAGTNSTDDEAWQVTGRFTYTPWIENDNVLHTGISTSYRVPNSATETFRYSVKAENDLQSSNVMVDTGASAITNANSSTLHNLELATALGSLSLQGEYTFASVERANGSDLDFSGWYAQASYFLTGETRKYIKEEGIFGRTLPKKPFTDGSGIGAWEVAARYSSLDLNDKDITGGEMNNYTAGVNWYVNNYTRLGANYITVDTDQQAVSPDNDPSIFLMRAQLDF